MRFVWITVFLASCLPTLPSRAAEATPPATEAWALAFGLRGGYDSNPADAPLARGSAFSTASVSYQYLNGSKDDGLGFTLSSTSTYFDPRVVAATLNNSASLNAATLLSDHLVLRGTLEASPRNDMDGALLEAINFGIVKDPALIKSTLDRMVTLRTASGGFRRVTGTTGYELQEFVFIDLALARALRGQGRTAEATAIERRLVTKANAQQSLIPEMYMSQNADDFEGPIGSPTGATPMVGYGAGAYILSMLGRRTGPQP